VKSAAAADDLPREGFPEVAMLGRSNVGKSSLINALVRQKLARTSAAPGKTRLANLYKVARGSSRPFLLVDLPGYGYARGGTRSAREFDELTQAFFGRVRRQSADPHPLSGAARLSALLLVDARHPGLDSDVRAWAWLKQTVELSALVATKIDKLARSARRRAMQDLESVFNDPALPVSAATGEGLDELWTLIDSLNNLHQTAPPIRSRGPAAHQSAPPKDRLKR
jgi:GTP-binding protein